MKVTLTSNGKLWIEMDSENSVERAFMETFREAVNKGQTVSILAPQDSELCIILEK